MRSLQTPLPLSGLGSLDLTQNLSPECATLSLLPWRFPHVSCASFPVPMCGGIAFKPPILRTSLWLDGVGSWAWRECCTGLAVCHLRPFSQPAPCPVSTSGDSVPLLEGRSEGPPCPVATAVWGWADMAQHGDPPSQRPFQPLTSCSGWEMTCLVCFPCSNTRASYSNKQRMWMGRQKSSSR